MKRSVIAVSLALLIGGAALAAESSDARKDLLAKRTELQNAMKDKRAKLAASDAVAGERKSVADAKKALEDKLASDPELQKARAAEKEAASKLEKAIAAKAAADPDSAAAQKQIDELEAKRRLLAFEAGLIELQLTHQYSPFMVEAANDPEVKALRQKADELDKEIESKPTDQVVAARKALADAQAALAKAKADAQITQAAQSLAAAQNALAEAKAADPRQAALKKARDAHDAARDKKLSELAEGKALLAEMAAIKAKLAENRKARRLNEEVLELHGLTIGAEDKEVGEAIAAVVAAKKAYDEAETSTGVADLRKQLTAAQAARDEKALAVALKDPAYVALAAKEKPLTEKAVSLVGRLKDLSPAEMKELAAARIELEDVTKGVYGMRRARWQDADVKAAFEKGDALYRAVGEKARTTPAVASAQQARQAAEKKLAAIRRAKVMPLAKAKPAIDEAAALTADEHDLMYRQAIAQFKLGSALSPVKAAVDADPTVVAADKAMDEAQAGPAAAAAAEAQKKVTAAQEALKAAQAKNADYAKADAAEDAAINALAAAQKADPRRAALAAAQAAVKAKLVEKAKASSKAADLVARHKKVEADLADIEKAKKDASGKLSASQKKAAASEDGAVGDLRKQVAEAQKTIKEAPKSERFADAQKAIKAAEEALTTKIMQLAAADAGIAAHEKELQGVNDKIKELDAAAKPKKADTPKKAATTQKASAAKVKPPATTRASNT